MTKTVTANPAEVTPVSYMNPLLAVVTMVGHQTGTPVVGMTPLLLTVALSLWCWLGGGPALLRWPLVIFLILLTSGHPFGGLVSSGLEELAGPILLLLIVAVGFSMILRSFRTSRRNPWCARRENDQWRR